MRIRDIRNLEVKNNMMASEKEAYNKLISLDRDYGGNAMNDQGNYLDDVIEYFGHIYIDRVLEVSISGGSPHNSGVVTIKFKI